MPMLPITGPLVVGTYNAGNGTQRRAAADLAALTGLVHALALQEVSLVSAQGKALVAFAQASRWQLHRGNGRGQDRTGILLHPDLPILARDFWLCTERTDVGEWGAGATILGRKWLAHVTTEDPTTGNPVTIGSTHLVASVTRLAVTKAARAARERRRELYRHHIGRLVQWAETRNEALIIAGDFNATPSYADLQPLRDAGFTVTTRPSRGPRPIDHLWSRDAR